MPRHRVPLPYGIAALAAAALVASAAAYAALPESPATAAASPGAAAVPGAVRAAAADTTPAAATTPVPSDSSEAAADRGEVDEERGQVDKATQEAKEDVAAAKGEATKCPPTDKSCMSDLAGDGAEQKQEMAKTEQQLEDVHPTPEDNAAAVLGGACDDFAAALPPALTSGGDGDAATSVCELMNQ